jgi:succinylglutamic semialdehyde dehydrogenase
MKTTNYFSHAGKKLFGSPEKTGNKFSPIDNQIMHTFQDDASAVSEAINYLSENRKAVLKLSKENLKNIAANFIKNIEDRHVELATMISQETGKAIWEAKTEATALKSKALASLEQWESHQTTIVKDALPGIQGEVHTKPLGIISVLGPFNFPMHLPNGQILPAILKGNSVLFKPSELTPGCAELYCRLWWDAGLPEGALALVQGQREVGIQATTNPLINGIFFTGSVPTGISILKATAETPQKLVALEMGGVNPLAIWSDANLEAAANAAVTGFCLSTGQRCTGTRRILIHQDVYKKFKALLLILTSKVHPGMPNENVFCGPLISAGSKDKFHAAKNRLLKSGGEITFEQKLNNQLPTTGGFVGPTIIEGGDIKQFVKEETFSPLIVLESFNKMDELLQKCAWSPYGLSASIFTAQENTYQEFWHGIQSGLINWNQPTNGASFKLPFGGVGLSGNYRHAGYDMIEHCSYKVSSLINTNPESLLKAVYPGLSELPKS